ncbi:MAG: hypothetical protein Q8865_11095 [Bacillota bacterium]|nr:hypothetical protein [Bacillota bacterium]
MNPTSNVQKAVSTNPLDKKSKYLFVKYNPFTATFAIKASLKSTIVNMNPIHSM